MQSGDWTFWIPFEIFNTEKQRSFGLDDTASTIILTERKTGVIWIKGTPKGVSDDTYFTLRQQTDSTQLLTAISMEDVTIGEHNIADEKTDDSQVWKFSNSTLENKIGVQFNNTELFSNEKERIIEFTTTNKFLFVKSTDLNTDVVTNSTIGSIWSYDEYTDGNTKFFTLTLPSNSGIALTATGSEELKIKSIGGNKSN